MDMCRILDYSFVTSQTNERSVLFFPSVSLVLVLPWLSSPNAYGLFSPGGGLTASITPKGLSTTPNRNVMTMSSTLTGDANKLTLPFEGSTEKRDASSAGMMICVSPLARKNGVTGHVTAKIKQPDTPINFHDVFASPKADGRHKLSSNEIPQISEASHKEAKLALEKHLAERDVMEDEDLNVLLKLAETTPRRNSDARANAGTRVFRGAGLAFAYPGTQPVGPPSSLHLPIIGKHTGSPSRFAHKSDSAAPGTLGKNAKIQGIPSPKKRKITGQTGAAIPGTTGRALPPHLAHRPPPGYYPSTFAGMPTGGMAHYPFGYPRNGHPPPPPYMYSNVAVPAGAETVKSMKKKIQASTTTKTPKATTSVAKRPLSTTTTPNKKVKKAAPPPSRGRGPGKKKAASTSESPLDKQKAAAAISAINSASGKKNDKAASLASAILRGVTMRPSGKWQAQLYFAGKSRYIGVFDSREKAALAYEIAREHLQNKSASGNKDTEAHVNAARKAAFEGVNETDPRV